ncbi:hypothetical protein FWF74_00900 [Candidatus Saccharibacteria bacterium]|nr:hypothetical protein [Candidatus Saccharibacteria bacterium]MCL1962992.1 hypothetical protein [Candidatus Saccharibacteria bacterium]
MDTYTPSRQPLGKPEYSRNEIIAHICASVDANRHILTFADQKKIYEKHPILDNTTNCFAWTIGATAPVKKGHGYGLYNPGSISGHEKLPATLLGIDLISGEELFEAYQRDLKFFNFTTSLSRDAMEAIFMVHKNGRGLVEDFHFIVHHPDDTYSEKAHWDCPPYEIKSPERSYSFHYQTVDSVRFQKDIKRSTYYMNPD